MAFDNIKLEKGLYATTKGFTASLEEIDPSENYIGTELEGLDAYQRQLKRFDIKVSGNGSDTISKFFQTSDSAALFPEYISRAVQQGIEESDTISRIVATTTTIDSLDYRAIESTIKKEDKQLAIVGEGAMIPETTIKTKDKLTKLYKRGRMLVASYEAIKFQKLDLFTITLKQIGAYISRSQMYDALVALDGSNQDDIIESLETEGVGLKYKDITKLWSSLYPYNMTTILANSESIATMLEFTEFKDSNAGQTFHGTGKMITPIGAEIIRCNDLDKGSIIALDNKAALEKVQVGNVVTEYDKLIDRQLERASITTIAGFSKIFSDASKMLTVKTA